MHKKSRSLNGITPPTPQQPPIPISRRPCCHQLGPTLVLSPNELFVLASMLLLLLLLQLLRLTSTSVIRDIPHWWLLPLFRKPLTRPFWLRVFHERWLYPTTRLLSCNVSVPWRSRVTTVLLIPHLKSCLSSHPAAPVLGLRFEDIFSARLCFAAGGVIIKFFRVLLLLLQRWWMGSQLVSLPQSLEWAEDAVVGRPCVLGNWVPSCTFSFAFSFYSVVCWCEL